MLHALDNKNKTRLLAAQAPHSGAWLFATPITAIGLRMSNETIRLAVGPRLGTRYVSHTHVRVEHLWTLEVYMACLVDELQVVTPDTVSWTTLYGAAWCVELKSLHRKSRLA